MSSASQASDADIAEVQLFTTGNHILYACIALYCYEWLITLRQEVNHVWTNKWTTSTWIFAANRYGTLLVMIIQAFPSPNRLSCVSEIYLATVFELLQFIIVALFTALRAYALCHRNLSVFLVVFGLTMVPFGTNMAVHVAEQVVFIPAYPSNVCSVISPFSADLELRVYIQNSYIVIVTLTTRIAVIMADIIVLVVSWTRAIGTLRAAARHNIRTPLFEFLVRDGSFFFVALLALNIYEILINNVPALVSLGVGSIFLTPLNSIIISRFMLNLRHVVNHPHESSGTAHNSSLRFNHSTLVGNMGEDLRFNEDEQHETGCSEGGHPEHEPEGVNIDIENQELSSTMH